MTTNRRQRSQSSGWLKGILVVGSMAATLIGAEMLAQQSSPADDPAPPPAVAAPETTLNGPAEQDEPFIFNLDNSPVPQVNIPTVLTQSRSSG